MRTIWRCTIEWVYGACPRRWGVGLLALATWGVALDAGAGTERLPGTPPVPVVLAPVTPDADLPGPAKRPSADTRKVGALLAHVDRVNVRFHGQPSLSGEYRINGDETISLPIIGRFDTRGMTLGGLEELLSREYLRATGRDIHPTVEVSAYRDVMVTGFIDRPGSHPWRRGMTVLHLEALGGGLFRPVANAAGPTFENERTKARRAAADVGHLKVQLARLRAERDGASSFEAPEGLTDIASRAEIASIMSAQQQLLRTRKAVFEAQKQALMRTSAVSAKELKLLREQLQKSEAQLEKRRKILAGLEGLIKSRVVTETRLLEEETKIASLEEHRLAQTLSLERLESSRQGADRELDVLEQQRFAAIDAELQSAERELALGLIDLQGAAASSRSLSSQSMLSPFADEPPVVQYRIIRSIDGSTATTTISAHRDSEVHPGDVLLIEIVKGAS